MKYSRINQIGTALCCLAMFACNVSKPIKKDIEWSVDTSRFRIETLATGMIDPTEIAVADNGDVIVCERKGGIGYYQASSKAYEIAGKIEINLGHEDGLLGIAMDPNFMLNRHIFVCYTPNPHREQRLSRFTLDASNKLDLKSEKIILSFPIVPERHQGGSVAFDKYGNLYLSTGENTKPTDINGHAPIDERAGHEINDSQRSASNTNDLRGKILRIHPMPDGSYRIPKGNLFPIGTPKTRPEIYIMGCRNPFRIALDPVDATLYWGDIGPDAGDDSEKGPMGYDEINKAKKAGNYGWPYFIANNKAYADLDYATNQIAGLFDPQLPINNSPNNTGMFTLPPAQAAWLWYPYSKSAEFPSIGMGGRTAIAGGVYAYHSHNKNGFPKWFDKKIIIADWMRNHLKVLAPNEKAKADSLFDFLPHKIFRRPIDMQFGHDGCLYVLEYGSNWFDNTDARLIKISYQRENLAPVVKMMANKTAGAVPLKVSFSSKGTFDVDHDSLIYEWRFDDGNKVQSKVSNPSYVFEKAGIYKVSLTATDSKGNSASGFQEIIVGNTPAEVSINFPNHGSFFWPEDKLAYEISVVDQEEGKINRNRYTIQHGTYSSSKIAAQPYGEKLIQESDCKSCHRYKGKSVGPSFEDISYQYNNSDDAGIQQLAKKIIDGGSGKWGTYVMSAHPSLGIEESKEMVKYILSLGHSQQNKLHNTTGSIDIQAMPQNPQVNYGISVNGIDKGINGKLALPFSASKLLKPAILEAKKFDTCLDIINSGDYARMPFPTSMIAFDNIDLKNVSSISIVYNYDFYYPNCFLNCRIGNAQGETIGKIELAPKAIETQNMSITFPIKEVIGANKLVFTYHPDLKIHAPLNLKSIIFNKSKNTEL